MMKPIDNWWVFPGFEIEHLVTGLDKPVNIAMVPEPGSASDDPLFYVTELYGRVRAITNDLEVHDYADKLLNFAPDYVLPGTGESGVIGLCIEPSSGDLFVSMIYQEKDGFKAKVVRMSSGNGLKMDSMETVISGIPSVNGAHQIHAVTIGPDGKLYANVGDAMLAPSPAQDGNDLRGKVLRLNLDGSVPDDNPRPGSPIFAKGFRSPFGATWRRSDSSLYISDNGPRYYDRIARVEAGGDYGWPTDMRQNSLFWWAFTQAPTALAFMQDGQFPQEFDDHLFLSLAGPARYKAPARKGKRIVKLQLNENGRGALSVDDFVAYTGEGLAMPVGLAFGCDGLYFTDLHGESDIYGREPGGNVFVVRPAVG
jgi:glucose/arabinose dehydrogenase